MARSSTACESAGKQQLHPGDRIRASRVEIVFEPLQATPTVVFDARCPRDHRGKRHHLAQGDPICSRLDRVSSG